MSRRRWPTGGQMPASGQPDELVFPLQEEPPAPPPPDLETPSYGALRAALQLTEEKTLLRAAWVIEDLARSEPEKATRDIYARIAQALRRGVNL